METEGEGRERMRWWKIIPILDLICLLVELSDPTTPFVRIGVEDVLNHKVAAVTQSVRLQPAEQAVLEKSHAPETSGVAHVPAESMPVSASHSAVAWTLFQLKVEWPAQNWIPADAPMADQAYPEILKRPPIAA